jgi:pimeloyl-ACP methyl ester carboxylesterase
MSETTTCEHGLGTGPGENVIPIFPIIPLVLTAMAICMASPFAGADKGPQADVVVLLHGLARTSDSMEEMAVALERAGYRVCNIDYPSRDFPIAELATNHVLPAIRGCIRDGVSQIHFVTHSLGGIITRTLVQMEAIPNLGRVVMLSPPNQGSEVVDELSALWLFELINGPAGMELGTREFSKPLSLGPADFELGIITGNKSINPILSSLIPGDDDGKVSVERAKLEGMADFLVLPVSHPFIMKDEIAIAQTLFFLRHGKFEPVAP